MFSSVRERSTTWFVSSSPQWKIARDKVANVVVRVLQATHTEDDPL